MAFWKKKKKRQTTAKKKTHAASPKTNSPKMKPVPEWKPTISMPTYKIGRASWRERVEDRV